MSESTETNGETIDDPRIGDINEGDVIRIPQYANALEVVSIMDIGARVEFLDDAHAGKAPKDLIANENSGRLYLITGSTRKGRVTELERVTGPEDGEDGEDTGYAGDGHHQAVRTIADAYDITMANAARVYAGEANVSVEGGYVAGDSSESDGEGGRVMTDGGRDQDRVDGDGEGAESGGTAYSDREEQFQTPRMRNAFYWAAQAAGWMKDGPNAGIHGRYYVEVIGGKPVVVLDDSFDEVSVKAVKDALRDYGFPQPIRIRELDSEWRLFISEPNDDWLVSNYDDEWRDFEVQGGFSETRFGSEPDQDAREVRTDGGVPEDPDGDQEKLILEYVDERHPDNGLRSTWYLHDGQVVVNREEWRFNYSDERRQKTTNYHVAFDLADDGVTVAHDGRRWDQYARAKTARGVALGPHTDPRTDEDDVTLTEVDSHAESAFADDGERVMTDGGRDQGAPDYADKWYPVQHDGGVSKKFVDRVVRDIAGEDPYQDGTAPRKRHTAQVQVVLDPDVSLDTVRDIVIALEDTNLFVYCSEDGRFNSGYNPRELQVNRKRGLAFGPLDGGRSWWDRMGEDRPEPYPERVQESEESVSADTGDDVRTDGGLDPSDPDIGHVEALRRGLSESADAALADYTPEDAIGHVRPDFTNGSGKTVIRMDGYRREGETGIEISRSTVGEGWYQPTLAAAEHFGLLEGIQAAVDHLEDRADLRKVPDYGVGGFYVDEDSDPPEVTDVFLTTKAILPDDVDRERVVDELIAIANGVDPSIALWESIPRDEVSEGDTVRIRYENNRNHRMKTKTGTVTNVARRGTGGFRYFNLDTGDEYPNGEPKVLRVGHLGRVQTLGKKMNGQQRIGAGADVYLPPERDRSDSDDGGGDTRTVRADGGIPRPEVGDRVSVPYGTVRAVTEQEITGEVTATAEGHTWDYRFVVRSDHDDRRRVTLRLSGGLHVAMIEYPDQSSSDGWSQLGRADPEDITVIATAAGSEGEDSGDTDGEAVTDGGLNLLDQLSDIEEGDHITVEYDSNRTDGTRKRSGEVITVQRIQDDPSKVVFEADDVDRQCSFQVASFGNPVFNQRKCKWSNIGKVVSVTLRKPATDGGQDTTRGQRWKRMSSRRIRRDREGARQQAAFEHFQAMDTLREASDANPGVVVKVGGGFRPYIRVNLESEDSHLKSVVADPMYGPDTPGSNAWYRVRVSYFTYGMAADFEADHVGEGEDPIRAEEFTPDTVPETFGRTHVEMLAHDERPGDQVGVVEEYIRDHWIPDYDGRAVITRARDEGSNAGGVGEAVDRGEGPATDGGVPEDTGGEWSVPVEAPENPVAPMGKRVLDHGLDGPILFMGLPRRSGWEPFGHLCLSHQAYAEKVEEWVRENPGAREVQVVDPENGGRVTVWESGGPPATAECEPDDSGDPEVVVVDSIVHGYTFAADGVQMADEASYVDRIAINGEHVSMNGEMELEVERWESREDGREVVLNLIIPERSESDGEDGDAEVMTDGGWNPAEIYGGEYLTVDTRYDGDQTTSIYIPPTDQIGGPLDFYRSRSTPNSPTHLIPGEEYREELYRGNFGQWEGLTAQPTVPVLCNGKEVDLRITENRGLEHFLEYLNPSEVERTPPPDADMERPLDVPGHPGFSMPDFCGNCRATFRGSVASIPVVRDHLAALLDGGEQGLYGKYRVLKDGIPVEDCFVLEPADDPAARMALAAYAEATENEALASGIREWLADLEPEDGVDRGDGAVTDGGVPRLPPSVDGYLRFDHANVGYVIDGLEDATVRYGLDRPFVVGDRIALLTPTDQVFAIAKVTGIFTGPVRLAWFDLTAADGRNHPADGVLDLWERMCEHYPDEDVQLSDEVTSIYFDLINVVGGGETPGSDSSQGANGDGEDVDPIDVDGATVTIGDTTIVIMSEGGEPASLDHTSAQDGYAAYVVGGENVTLRFLPSDSGQAPDGGREDIRTDGGSCSGDSERRFRSHGHDNNTGYQRWSCTRCGTHFRLNESPEACPAGCDLDTDSDPDIRTDGGTRTDVEKKFVIYVCDDGRVETHGGPYAPDKAREVKEAMASHIARGNYRDWNIPEDAISVVAVTRETLRELRGDPDPDDIRTDGCGPSGDRSGLEGPQRIKANPLPGYAAWAPAERCPECDTLLEPLYYGILGFKCPDHGVMVAKKAKSVPWRSVDDDEVWWESESDRGAIRTDGGECSDDDDLFDHLEQWRVKFTWGENTPTSHRGHRTIGVYADTRGEAIEKAKEEMPFDDFRRITAFPPRREACPKCGTEGEQYREGMKGCPRCEHTWNDGRGDRISDSDGSEVRTDGGQDILQDARGLNVGDTVEIETASRTVQGDVSEVKDNVIHLDPIGGEPERFDLSMSDPPILYRVEWNPRLEGFQDHRVGPVTDIHRTETDGGEDIPPIPDQIQDVLTSEELENMRALNGWAAGTVALIDEDGDVTEEIPGAWIELFDGEGSASVFDGVRFYAVDDAGEYRESYAHEDRVTLEERRVNIPESLTIPRQFGSARYPAWFVKQYTHGGPEDPTRTLDADDPHLIRCHMSEDCDAPAEWVLNLAPNGEPVVACERHVTDAVDIDDVEFPDDVDPHAYSEWSAAVDRMDQTVFRSKKRLTGASRLMAADRGNHMEIYESDGEGIHERFADLVALAKKRWEAVRWELSQDDRDHPPRVITSKKLTCIYHAFPRSLIYVEGFKYGSVWGAVGEDADLPDLTPLERAFNVETEVEREESPRYGDGTERFMIGIRGYAYADPVGDDPESVQLAHDIAPDNGGGVDEA